MAAKLFLKPGPGRLVFREDATEWPAEGEFASTASKYVRRRIRDEDLVEAQPPKKAKAEASAQADALATETTAADADKSPRKRS
jgi:hypothetical protein